MKLTDPIADMLIRIKNAQAVGKKTVRVPFSKLKYILLQIMEKEGFITKAEKKGKDVSTYIKVDLKYQNNIPVINDLKRISKPGKRVYTGKDQIKQVKQGYGIAVISTSQGLLTDKEAKKQKIGGEIMCEIW